jgi:predicted ribosome quality control (RQC) complex YloA/Tae2 family protein
MFFNKAKKSRQKAKYLHIERENLQNKRDYFTQVHKLIKEAQTVQAIDTLMPKQKSKNKKERQKPYEVFWFDTYKVLLGRNTKANQALLQDAKANDMWFHLKDRPSAHVLIVSDKQKIPMDIIQRAAQLCVDFTVNSSGRFSVDYTKRKEVSIQEGANVLYNKYETVIVQKD